MRTSDNINSGREGKNHLIFAILAIAFGSAYAVLLPPLQAPDEFAHFYRAYSVSEGYLVAPDNISVPRAVALLSTRFRFDSEKQSPFHFSDLPAALAVPLDLNDRVNVRAEAMNIYIFIPYLPGAAGIAIGRILHLSALALLYSARFSNLTVFIALVLLAFRLLPDFRSVLLGLALMPTCLHQAASASWDGFCYASAFLFVAYILRLAFGNDQGPMRPVDYSILALLIALNALLKMNVCLSLLILLIPAKRLGGIFRKWRAFFGYAVLIWLEIVWWRTVDAQRFEAYRLARLAMGITLDANLHFLEFHPLLFLQAIFRTSLLQGFSWLNSFVATIGWLAASIPAWIVIVYISTLVLAALTQARTVMIEPDQRWILILSVAAGSGAVFAALLYAETRSSYLPTLLSNQGYIPIVQGRYFIPVAIPALATITGRKLSMRAGWFAIILVAVISLANISALNALTSTYYRTLPPSSKYEHQLVRRPGDSPEDTKIYVVMDGKKRWVVYGDWFAAHGYRWPDDVHVIPADELDAIVTGLPVHEQR